MIAPLKILWHISVMKNTIIALVLLLVGTGVASAQTGTSASAGAGVQTEIRGGSVDVDSHTEVDVDTGGTKRGGDSQRVLPTVNKIEVEASDGAAMSDKRGSDDNGGSGSERLLPTVNKKTAAKVEVRGWDPSKKEEISQRVETEVEDNVEVSGVVVAEDQVSVDDSVPAKLFGFIPITMNMNVSADAQGTVKVRFPWFRFLATTDFADTQSDMDHVFQNNQTNLEFLRTKDSVQAQLEVVATISNVLKTKHDTVKNSIGNVR